MLGVPSFRIQTSSGVPLTRLTTRSDRANTGRESTRRSSLQAWSCACWLAIPALVGCVTPPTEQNPAQTDTGVLMEWVEVENCTVDDSRFGEVTATLAEVETVISLSWETPTEAVSFVVFGEEGQAALRTPASLAPTTSHTTLLRGLHASTEVHYRLVIKDDESLFCSEERATQTGSLPSALPLFTFTEGEAEADEGYVMMPVLTEDQAYLTVVDTQGRYVWALPRDETVWRVRQDASGDAMLINRHAQYIDQPGSIMRVDYAGNVEEVASVRGAHTDFVALPGGAFATLGWVVRDFETEEGTRRILGDTLIELAPGGGKRVLWNVFDHFTPDLTETYEITMNVADDAEDWSHANGLSYDAENDQFLITVSGIHTIVGVDRESGDQLWSVGEAGVEGEHYAADTELVYWPHSAYSYDADHIVVFNRNDYAAQECSEVEILRLDDETGTAEPSLVYEGLDCLSVYYLGEAQPITDGGIQVIWTTSGRVDHIDSDGALRWSLTADLGAGIAFSDYTPSLYPSGG